MAFSMKLRSAAALTGLLLTAATSVAHHSATMFDEEKFATFTGIVKDFQFDPRRGFAVE